VSFNGLSPLRLSTGVIENSKSQINNNDQSACGGPNLFWSFDIGIRDLFVTWCLKLEIS
jgi:hypothetical protein